MKEKWETYNPEWIIKIATEQIPDSPKIINVLTECSGFRTSRAYIYSSTEKTQINQIRNGNLKKILFMRIKENGTIVLDVLKGNKIGGIEFLKFIQ